MNRSLIGLILVILCAAGWALSPMTGLQIIERDSFRLLLPLSLRPGESFTIMFIHSIAKRPVEETLHIAPNGSLILDRVVWDMNGAGLPYELEPGMDFKTENGKFVLSRMNREFPEVVLAVGMVADHHLLYGERMLALDGLIAPGKAVRFRAGRLPRALYWYGAWKWRALSERL